MWAVPLPTHEFLLAHIRVCVPVFTCLPAYLSVCLCAPACACILLYRPTARLLVNGWSMVWSFMLYNVETGVDLTEIAKITVAKRFQRTYDVVSDLERE